MRAVVSLTPSESKRLIAKGTVAHPMVRKALKHGIIFVGGGTTNGYVIEEITGKKIDPEKKCFHACGIIVPKGLCINDEKPSRIFFVKGEMREFPMAIKGKLTDNWLTKQGEIVMKMGPEDVLIKGANALDPNGHAAVLVASYDGGEAALMANCATARGVKLIVPVGLEKLVPTSVEAIMRECGTRELDYSLGLHVRLVPLPGEVITEVESLRLLFGVEVIPISAGGLSGAEGSIVLLLKGANKAVMEAVKIIESVKGEPPTPVYPTRCGECGTLKDRTICSWREMAPENLPKFILS